MNTNLIPAITNFNPKPAVNAPSKKAFHVINRNGQFQGRLAFHPAVHSKFNKDTQFHSVWETSNFFDVFLPEGVSYGEITGYSADSQSAEGVIDWMEDKGRTGFKNVQCNDGKAHRVIYGDWDGDRGQAIVVPVDAKIKSLTDLGLKLTMKSKADVPKVRKYFRRVRAHHEWALAGAFTAQFETAIGHGENFTMGGIESSVLYVDLKNLSGDNLALADGMHLVHIDFLKAIGLDQYEVGDAFKGTFLGAGLGKGFFHVVDHIDFGVILYGPKTQIGFDKIFFGSLGDVKGGEAFTDLQAMINFDVCDEGFAFGLAQTFLREVDEAMHNEDKLRALLMHNLPEPSEILSDEANRAETWVLLEALRLGIPILKNPGLFRRAVRFFATKVMDTAKGRIPFGPIARRFNLMPDINVFGSDGSVDVNRSSIQDGQVVCMDSGAGDFFMYRQPSGHKLEGVRAVCVHDRRFRKFLGRDRVIVGHGAARVLGTMGGGDMDDAVIGTSNHSLVEIMSIGDYPLTALPAADAAVLESANPYSKGRKYPAVWDMSDYFDAMTKAREISLSIGPIVNSVMLDTLLSGRHKENMLNYLADSIADSNDEFAKDGYRAAYDWLRNREDHQLKTVASNLESFIDYIKMAKGDPMVLEPLVALVAKVRDESLVLPQCWTIGGSKGTGRITQKRLDTQDFVLAPSLVCETLQKIAVEVSHLEAAAREEEWFMVDKMPEALDLAFPVTGRFMDGSHEDPYMSIAMELRSFWAEEWTAVLGRQNVTEQESELERERITKHLKATLAEYADAPEIQQAIVVSIARLTYRRRHTEPRLNQDGTVRSFPDGLLWNNYVGNIYINAMKEAGLTGLYVAVHFDRWSAALKNTVCQVEVLDGGLIRRPEDNFLVGYVNSSEHVKPGLYSMNYGLITVSEPSDELRMDSNVVDEMVLNNGGREEEVAFN